MNKWSNKQSFLLRLLKLRSFLNSKITLFSSSFGFESERLKTNYDQKMANFQLLLPNEWTIKTGKKGKWCEFMKIWVSILSPWAFREERYKTSGGTVSIRIKNQAFDIISYINFLVYFQLLEADTVFYMLKANAS